MCLIHICKRFLRSVMKFLEPARIVVSALKCSSAALFLRLHDRKGGKQPQSIIMVQYQTMKNTHRAATNEQPIKNTGCGSGFPISQLRARASRSGLWGARSRWISSSLLAASQPAAQSQPQLHRQPQPQPVTGKGMSSLKFSCQQSQPARTTASHSHSKHVDPYISKISCHAS